LHEEYAQQLESSLAENLSRFSDHITRLEVHLSDENGNKESKGDKKCMLEARLKGKQPIAVSTSADTYDQAVDNATDKLTASLHTIMGKSQNY